MKHAKQIAVVKKCFTLNCEPMEENFDCFDVSSGKGGKRLATNVHFEAHKRA
jgi:hypothetical protein